MKSSRLAATLAAIVAISGGVAGCGQQSDDSAKKSAAVQPAPKAVPPTPPQAAPKKVDYLRAVYSPLHFKPASESASNAQCLECHQEVLSDKVRESSPAGLKAASAKAWYQELATYSGEQDTLHRRHLETPLAKSLMNLQCSTCHEGQDPREEAPVPPTKEDAGYTLRKQVNPEKSCLKCHGQLPYKVMGLPGPWSESKAAFGNNCLTCHAAIRTVRHQVTYLNADAIEKAAQDKGGDVCYGCHGGRAWYRISYSYPRNAWQGMGPETPDWAKGRPTESEERFRVKAASSAAAQPPKQ